MVKYPKVKDYHLFGGTPTEVKARGAALLDTFKGILNKRIELIDGAGEAPRTDCVKTIYWDSTAPGCYLHLEHELGHHLFHTDPTLYANAANQWIDQMIAKAGIQIRSAEGSLYRTQLQTLCHDMWNALEDFRILHLWGEIYYGSFEMQVADWGYMAEQMEDPALTSPTHYLLRLALGIETDKSECVPYRKQMLEAVRLVKSGIDGPACVAVTIRLMDQLSKLLPKPKQPQPSPPPPPSPASGNSASAASGQQPQQQPQQQQQSQQQQSQQQQSQSQVTQLSSLAARESDACSRSKSAPRVSHPVAEDTQKDAFKNLRVSHSKRQDIKDSNTVQDLLKAALQEKDPNAPMSQELENILSQGKAAAEAQVQALRAAAAGEVASEAEKSTDELLDDTAPMFSLPYKKIEGDEITEPPSDEGRRAAIMLENLRRSRRARKSVEGDNLNVEDVIEGMSSGNFDAAKPFERIRQEQQGVELLLILDVSGSMSGAGREYVNRALTELQLVVRHPRVRTEVWCFSNELFRIEKLRLTPVEIYGGQTHTRSVLSVALVWAEQKKKDRAVILVTDGEPTDGTGRNGHRSLREVVEAFEEQEIPLQTIIVGTVVPEERGNDLFGSRVSFARAIEALPEAMLDAVSGLIASRI